MAVTVRRLEEAEVLALTPERVSLAPIFAELEKFGSAAGGILLAESGGVAVGLAAVVLEEETLEIRHFAVSGRHHGQGIGSKLLAAVLEEGRRRSAGRIHARIPGWCPDWRGFYSRAGFTFLERKVNESLGDLVEVERVL